MEENLDQPLTPMSRKQVWLLAATFEGGMAVVAVLVGWLIGYPPWVHLPTLDEIDVWAKGVARGVAGSLPMIAGMLMAIALPNGPLARLARFLEEVVVPLFSRCRLIDLAFVCAMAGLGEELLFRGLIQDVTTAWWGPTAGIIATSVLFGLAHPFTPTYAITAAIIGAYLSWLRMYGGDLVAPIVAHAVYDFGALVYFLRRQTT